MEYCSEPNEGEKIGGGEREREGGEREREGGEREREGGEREREKKEYRFRLLSTGSVWVSSVI